MTNAPLEEKMVKMILSILFSVHNPPLIFFEEFAMNYKLPLRYFWLSDWCYIGCDTVLCLGHKVEQLFNQLHMKKGAEEKEDIGVDYHIISCYPHTTQQDGNIIPIDTSLMPRRAMTLTQVWLAPLGFALQNEICVSTD